MNNSSRSGHVNSDIMTVWRNVYNNYLIDRSIETKGTYFILLKVCTDFPSNVPEDVYLIINMYLNGSRANFANAVNDSTSSDTYYSNTHCGGPGRINHLAYAGFCKLEADDDIASYVSYNNSSYQLRIINAQLIVIRLA